MSGTQPQLSSLEVRKQLLLAESEVNRAQLVNELAHLREETHTLVRQMGSVCSAMTSVASMGIAGFKAFRELRTARRQGKTSWLSTLISSVRLGTSLWTLFRSQSR